MGPASIHIDPAGHGRYLDSMPASSTPTIDVSFDRAGLGDLITTGTSVSSNSSTHQPIPPAPLWPHRLSASFSAMADQIAAASQALALVPPTAFSGSDVGAEVGALKGKLERIERTQERMMAEFEALKAQFTTLGVERLSVHANGRGTKTETVEGEAAPDPVAQAARMDELESKLHALSETVKLDQQRLPVRLHNARATVLKATLKTPVMANGKPAPGFPVSRGEFEHITKERYEALLKLYGQPLKGDTEAKREALRAFSGIPQDEQ